MKIRTIQLSLFAVVTFVCFAVNSSWAEEDSNRLAQGALVGAGTNVIGGAALDSLDGSSQAQPQYVQAYGPDGQPYWQQVAPAPQDPNKTILKRAVQGAITGAVAAEFSGDDKNEKSSSNNVESLSAVSNALNQKSSREDEDDDQDGDRKGHKKSKDKHSKEHKDKEGHRPPGWDRGKKVGWGDGDVPPGHQEDMEHPEVESEKESKSWWSGLFGGKDEA